jgi:uracil-DNA glycosylase
MQRWTERQRAMLKALGVGAFWPVPVEAAPDEVQAPAAIERANPAIDQAQVQVPTQPPAQAPRVAPAARAPVPVKTTTQAPTPVPTASHVQAPRPQPSNLDWPALTQAIQSCQACGLCGQRKQAVVGTGHAQARWMLVGEAPGEQEDLHGEPFVGRAGQLLDRMLQASGLTRADATPEQQVYIANVIKCRPPGNRNPTPEEVQQCEPYLVRQVQLVQPRLIVAMGRFAAQALLKSSEPIGKLRGRIHDFEGTPVVVTYHPAYLLRNPADKALAWDDWCLARSSMAKLAT